jgi:hypothetical protein
MGDLPGARLRGSHRRFSKKSTAETAGRRSQFREDDVRQRPVRVCSNAACIGVARGMAFATRVTQTHV